MRKAPLAGPFFLRERSITEAVMTVQTVVFDVGETLIDETRMWAGWARWLGVSLPTFLSALEETIAAGRHHREALRHFRAGLDVDAARIQRAAVGDLDIFDARDLYPDALPCLEELRRRGLRIGIAGNQPREAEVALGTIGFAADFVASSSRWGVEKPSPEFFARVAQAAGMPASEIAYVGDRLDNDVLPARAAGMIAVFIERGPWGRAHARRTEISAANLYLRSLSELPNQLAQLQNVVAKGQL